MGTRQRAPGLFVAVAVLASASGATASAQAVSPRSVLTIHVGPESFPANPVLDAGIRAAVTSRPDVPINYFAEYLESDLFPEKGALRAFEEYIRGKYQNRRIDVVVTTTDSGLRFVMDHRAELFQDAPIVGSVVEVPDDTIRRRGAGIGVIRLGIAYAETLKQALALHPSTERVFVVANFASARTENLIRSVFRDSSGGIEVTFLDAPTLSALVRTVKDIPARSLLLYQGQQQMEAGNLLYADEIARRVAGAASVPVYGTSDFYIGTGVVGGVVRDTGETARRLGTMALEILTGRSAGDMPVEDTPVAPIFDWRVMQRWGISESRLPAGSTVRFRAPSLWRDYRREVLSALGILFIQSLLILGLLAQRRARRRAEDESRRNMEIAADANRRVTMSALAGSIAHDLSQPLNSILHNAKAAELLVGSNRGTPETLREILADIRSADVQATQIIERHRTMLRNRQLERKAVDVHVVVRESLALVSHGAKARHIPVDVSLQAAPCFIEGDQVLLQQVLVNLLMNGIEAMAETAPDRRRVSVQSEVRPDSVAVSVRDAGTGLPGMIDGELFEPFVTTKANGIGIGLTIARLIVEAHEGKMEARNNPEGGATFTVTLPRTRPPAPTATGQAGRS